MQLSWASPNVKLNTVQNPTQGGMQAMYTVVMEIVPEYNGRQMRCDIWYDPMPSATYPSEWDFAINVPEFTYTFAAGGSFNVLCKYTFFQDNWQNDNCMDLILYKERSRLSLN